MNQSHLSIGIFRFGIADVETLGTYAFLFIGLILFFQIIIPSPKPILPTVTVIPRKEVEVVSFREPIIDVQPLKEESRSSVSYNDLIIHEESYSYTDEPLTKHVEGHSPKPRKLNAKIIDPSSPALSRETYKLMSEEELLESPVALPKKYNDLGSILSPDGRKSLRLMKK